MHGKTFIVKNVNPPRPLGKQLSDYSTCIRSTSINYWLLHAGPSRTHPKPKSVDTHTTDSLTPSLPPATVLGGVEK